MFLSAVRMFQPDFAPVISLPQKVKHEIVIPGDDGVQALLKASEAPLYTAILLSAVMGLRRSEICALEWSDLCGDTLYITKAMVLSEDKEWVIKTTKTVASTRAMKVPAVVLDHLDTLPREQRIVPITSDGITYRFVSLRDKLGINMRFHDLRHHYASTLMEIGIPDLYAMRRMGHSTPNMLKAVYQHMKDAKEAEIDEAIYQHMDALYK